MTYQKHKLHPRNKHQGQYDFEQLVQHYAKLQDFILVNQYGKTSIDFFDAEAVKALNKALLNCYYGINQWDIPKGYLCPPIPGRADYLHYIADLLASDNRGKLPKGKKIKVLDIGVGANCIYPIIGVKEYGWSFVGVDISKEALKNAHHIVLQDKQLLSNIELRLQPNPKQLFKQVVTSKDYINVSICNPPFYASEKEAINNNLRKVKNLTKKSPPTLISNFGGQHHELWCTGGELQFVTNMILESPKAARSIGWFTCLISREAHLKTAYKMLTKVAAKDVRTIDMGQGNKKSRLLAWRF